MTTKTIDLKKDTQVKLPSDFKGRLFVLQGMNSITFSREPVRTFSEIRSKIKKAKIRISPQIIEKEIQAHRRSKAR
ncbi:MAG: hypothetical protein WAP74_00330 [Patescibacteria group bacterium]